MQRFEKLTRGGQIRRMRCLAETALAAYALGAVRLTPLMHFFNTTFRVDACSQLQRAGQRDLPACKGERYVIRIHRPGSQNAAAIQSELIWLLALRQVFGLIHADFYERNYLFSKGEVHAIDFDGCDWGHYLFDIGVTFSDCCILIRCVPKFFKTRYVRCLTMHETDTEVVFDPLLEGLAVVASLNPDPLEARPVCGRGWSSTLAPSRSPLSAANPFTLRSNPRVSPSRCRFRPWIVFPPSEPRASPRTELVVRDCLSTMAAAFVQDHAQD